VRLAGLKQQEKQKMLDLQAGVAGGGQQQAGAVTMAGLGAVQASCAGGKLHSLQLLLPQSRGCRSAAGSCCFNSFD
jgi:hypothetical protein